MVLCVKNRPLHLPLKIEKNGNSLNKFFLILKFMGKYLLNKLIFTFSKDELFICCEQCLPTVRQWTRGCWLPIPDLYVSCYYCYFASMSSK